MNTLAERLLYARKQAGLSQAALGELVGLSQPMIRKIEQGSETSKVVEIAVAVGVRPEWLATGAGPVSESSKGGIRSGDANAQVRAALERLIRATEGLSAAQIDQLTATIEALHGSPAVREIAPDGTITDHPPDPTIAPPHRSRTTR